MWIVVAVTAETATIQLFGEGQRLSVSRMADEVAPGLVRLDGDLGKGVVGWAEHPTLAAEYEKQLNHFHKTSNQDGQA